MKFFYVFLFALAVSGCATHKSPLQSIDKYIFVTSDEEAIFQAAYDAMLEGRKDSPIVDIYGPIRGYSLTRKWALDYWTSMIRVFPAEGKTNRGDVVRGYYPEVSGEGTLIIRGPSMDEKIYDAALRKFSKVGRKVKVTTIERGEYRMDRDAFRLHEKPSPRDGRTIKTDGLESDPSKGVIEDRLQELERLRSRELITEEEYKRARAQILKDL